MKVISGFPCIGKTVLAKKNIEFCMDLEFKETATVRGMSDESMDRVFNAYGCVVEEIYNSNFYKFLFVTDNKLMLKELSKRKIPFTYVIPDITDKEFMEIYRNRVIHRDDEDWYNRIIVPRLDMYFANLNYVRGIGNTEIRYINAQFPYLSDLLKEGGTK